MKLDVTTRDGAYPILIDEGALERLPELIPTDATGLAVVTDETVVRHWWPEVSKHLARRGAVPDPIVLPAGESHKGWNSLDRIFTRLLEDRLDRKAVLLALGGGVVGDVAGLAAALYQRGIRYVQVPTTLLAQVDSSVGGKTAINHPLGKNMIGAFHPPQGVVIDPRVLQTLPDREITAGLAEVIKHGLIADPEYLAEVEHDMHRLRARDPEALIRAVHGSCRIKAALVSRDERESGVREWLNLGHTFGHAIEAGLGYGQWLHGEAVGCGLIMASRASQAMGWIDAATVSRVVEVVRASGCPVQAPRLASQTDQELATWLDLMSHDKKARAGAIRFILLKGLAQPVVAPLPDTVLASVLDASLAAA
jgi:3-dehydroquinate synthase